MASKETLIARALRLLGVLGGSEWPQASDRATAALALWDLHEELSARRLAWWDLGASALAYDETDRIPDEAMTALVRILCAELAEYAPPGRSIDREAERAAGERLLAAIVEVQTIAAPAPVTWF